MHTLLALRLITMICLHYWYCTRSLVGIVQWDVSAWFGCSSSTHLTLMGRFVNPLSTGVRALPQHDINEAYSRTSAG